MDNESATPPPGKGNKWLRMGKKILFGAILAWIIHNGLLVLDWDTWEKFSKKADAFAEVMLQNTARLTPVALWKSITSNDGFKVRVYDGDNSGNSLNSQSAFTYRKLTWKEKAFNWVSNYWYTDSGKAFWFGRILLVLAVIVGIGTAQEDYKSSRNKAGAIIQFPFKVIFWFFFFLLGLSLWVVFFYFLIKLLLVVVGGLVTIFTGCITAGGFIKLLVEEARSEVGGTAKKNNGRIPVSLSSQKSQYKSITFSSIVCD